MPFQRKKSPQEIFTGQLSEALDNRFFLLKNLILPGQGKLFPLLLLGPTGLWAVLPTDLAGLFRANESSWEHLDESRQAYAPVKPNLMLQVSAWAKAINESLVNAGLQAPPVEPVLFFSDPGAHVDTARPAARIVLADGLPHFLAGIFQARLIYEMEDLKLIVSALAGEEALEPSRAGQDIRDDFSLRERKEPEKRPPKPPQPPSRLATMASEEPAIVKKVSRHVLFTRQQWILLGALFLAAVLLLVALVFVILINS